jgi:uncharacterized membrane protein YeaQ/YmgE (transglycosylase-associated protein family)
MFHLIWYVLIGLVSGIIAKAVMHVHMTIFWTIILGIIGSILGGGVSHMFSRPTNERYHPAGLIVSTLGAILVLFICYKLRIHFPQVNPVLAWNSLRSIPTFGQNCAVWTVVPSFQAYAESIEEKNSRSKERCFGLLERKQRNMTYIINKAIPKLHRAPHRHCHTPGEGATSCKRLSAIPEAHSADDKQP